MVQIRGVNFFFYFLSFKYFNKYNNKTKCSYIYMMIILYFLIHCLVSMVTTTTLIIIRGTSDAEQFTPISSLKYTCVYACIFLCAYIWWLLLVVEVFASSNDSEGDAVGSSKPLGGNFENEDPDNARPATKSTTVEKSGWWLQQISTVEPADEEDYAPWTCYRSRHSKL